MKAEIEAVNPTILESYAWTFDEYIKCACKQPQRLNSQEFAKLACLSSGRACAGV
jgi:hypothetical protein